MSECIMQSSYNLKEISELEKIIDNPSKENIDAKKFKYIQWLHNNKIYHILKYNKENLNQSPELSLCRSIIFSNGKINVFSPPKSVSFESFKNKFDIKEVYCEEIIEGTMINIFFDKEKAAWNIATKTSVGGKIKYFQDQPKFNELFEEICQFLNLDLNELDNSLMYSLVMQHPKNRIVLPVCEMKLYLISIYKIDNLEIIEIPRENYNSLNLNNVFSKLWFPYRFLGESYERLESDFGSINTHIFCVGIMIKSMDGTRTKIINPNYKNIKDLKGNNSKLQYQYLCLRKENKVKDYLYYFPEAKQEFAKFRKQIHDYTNELHSNYINCFIKKDSELKNYALNFRIHMYNLHQKYISMRENNGYINKKYVINYVNSLESAELMYALNYSLRQLGYSYIYNTRPQ